MKMIKTTPVVMAQIQANALKVLEMRGDLPTKHDENKFYDKLKEEMELLAWYCRDVIKNE